MDFYLIKLFLPNLSNVFVIWGQNEFSDSFLIDKENRILSFLSLESVKDFIEEGEEAYSFDQEEFDNYTKLFSNDITFYSIKEVYELLSKNQNMHEFSRDHHTLLTNVYNLISDYFFQIKSEKHLLLRENVHIKMFFDHYYYKYFWKAGNELIETEKKLKDFNYTEFATIFKILLNTFVESIRIVSK